MGPTTGSRDTTPSPRSPSELASIAAINALIDEETVEDGHTHSAEPVLRKYIEHYGATGLIEHAFAAESPIRSADLIRLLGRISEVANEHRRVIVERGLASPHFAVRDAALQAAESWEDGSLVDLLNGHRDLVPWLNQYAEKIMRDLGI